MKILNKIFSMSLAIVLLLIFASASALATFIESRYGTNTAWALVYGTFWFGLVQFLLGLNLAFNIYKYKLFTKAKMPSFIFHISFLFILAGAILTRYFGVEGLMHIRNNQSANSFTTSQSYIDFKAISKDKIYEAKLPKYISKTGENDFSLELDVNGKIAKLKYEGFMPNAIYDWGEAKSGPSVAKLIFSDEKHSRNLSLKYGDSVEIGDLSFGFGDRGVQDKFVNIYDDNGTYILNSNQTIKYLKMADMTKGEFAPNTKIKFEDLMLYSVDGLNFTLKNIFKHAKLQAIKSDSKDKGADALMAKLSFNGETKDVVIFENLQAVPVMIDGVTFRTTFAPLTIKLPFSVYLDKFELKRYPGSNSPMSYSSYVKIVDDEKSFDYHIYMNHILDFKGYRFFQSSYDLDEKGTILSVNQDPGKIPTYIGYFLLAIGLFLNILNPKSRFRILAKAINNNKNTFALLFLVLFAAKIDVFASERLGVIPKSHIEELQSLIVQSPDGRMKPFDTASKDILNKIYRADNYKGENANSVVLSMMLDTTFWQNEPIIKISDKKLKKLLGINENAKYASFNDFFIRKDGKIYYKMMKESELANRKAPASRSKFDRDIIKADEKLNILYIVFSGELFRVIPRPFDSENKWYSPAGLMNQYVIFKDKGKAIYALQNYLENVMKAMNSNDWTNANKALLNLKNYQIEYGEAVMPSQNKIKFELLFNKLKVFQNLISVYLLAGFALLIIVLTKMLRPKANLGGIFKFVYYITVLGFLAQTLGLGIRWYISGHAPWSDSYESLVYIAWALVLSGIVFAKKSSIAMALTSILAGVTLFVAHLSWIDPQITTIMPVLKSYWLTIHVSVITASYGFLGLCSLLGFFTLILFAFQGKKENLGLSRNIDEACKINEMAMILGLSLLVVGNFLGGVWANESWGRYWGWDSKETWALISILVYAVVLHLRYVRGFNSQYFFALTSMFAYLSILMTYFGVNFYLSGMHSYASGDPVKLPIFVWIGLIVMFGISLLALRGKKYSKKL